MDSFLIVAGWSIGTAGPIVFLLGAVLFAIGLKGILTQKPVLFQMKHFIWSVLLLLVLLAVLMLGMLLTVLSFPYRLTIAAGLPMGVMLLLLVVMQATAAVVGWKELDGYTILGVTESSLHNGLLHALHQLEIPFQEIMFGVRLVEQNAHISTSTTAWLGSAQLRIRPKEHRRLLEAIGESLKQYYRDTAVPVNQNSFVLFSFIGLGIMVLAAGIVFVFFGIMSFLPF